MATVTKPLALNESLNSTENTPRNIADVLADELDGIKQAINSQSGSGNGHIIQNSSGANMPSENTMQFIDAHLSDDSVGGKTKVETFKAVTEAEYSSETEDGAYIITDGDGATIGPASEDYVEVVADGEKNIRTLLNELYALVDWSKVGNDSYIKQGTRYYKYQREYESKKVFSLLFANTSHNIVQFYALYSSNSAYLEYDKDNLTDASTTSVPSDGTKITLYYGNKKAVVDLQTMANRCVTSDGGTVQQALDNIFGIISVPIAGTVISNYYGTVNTGLDTSIYTAIGLYETDAWDENCNYTINSKGLNIHIKCRLQSYTIPNAIGALKVIYVKNSMFN